MKKYYLAITILFLGLTSCSNDERKAKNETASRNIIMPIKQDRTVKVGTQTWMTKNLEVSRYRNGDIIPQVTNQNQWAGITTGAWCYYNNDPVKGKVYGKLYNWYAVNDTRGLAPAGYHVASVEESNTLLAYLGYDGGKLKETGYSHWFPNNYAATNSSGFRALPGGLRKSDPAANVNSPIEYSFLYINSEGHWWSSTSTSTWFASDLRIYGGEYTSETWTAPKNCGLSVRCIKD